MPSARTHKATIGTNTGKRCYWLMSLLHERLPQCERLLQGTLRVVRVSVFSTDWDDFAARCGASPYCARNYLRIYGLLYGLHLFEFVQHQDGVQTKIGQCAVVCGRRARRFLDGIQLLPGFDHYWNNAVAAVLQVVGPGRYHYGSGWRLETPREKELDGLTGVSIDHIQRVVVEAVDFSRWASWEEYSRSISINARRNAKRAINMHSDVTLVFRRGLWTMVSVPCLTWLRRLMLRRKGGEFSMLQGLSALVRPLVWQRCTVSASVRVGKRTTAVFSGIEFGPNTYFIQGACRVPNNGTAWHMFLTLLRDAFERSPHGKFIMGANNEAAGPTRFQQECRTSAYLTSIVQFTYRNTPL
jgi:hypothetical protein